MLSQNGNILLKNSTRCVELLNKLLFLNFMKKTTQNSQSFRISVTTSLTRGQYAWFSTSQPVLNQQVVDIMENHQRLNVEKHSPEWYRHWLVGFVDGDGCFSIDKTKKYNGTIVWNLVFKISQNRSNKRVLMKIKTLLGAGKINTTKDNMCHCVFVIVKFLKNTCFLFLILSLC